MEPDWKQKKLNSEYFQDTMHNSFIFCVPIIIVFIKQLVEQEKHCDSVSRSPGSVQRSDCGTARPIDGPRLLNAGNHFSDLMQGKQAFLINADLNGWMDGTNPNSTPPLSHATTFITTNITSTNPPRGQDSPLEYYYTLQASNQLMDGYQTGWWRICHISDLLGKNKGWHLHTERPCLDPNIQKTPRNRKNSSSSVKECSIFFFDLQEGFSVFTHTPSFMI